MLPAARIVNSAAPPYAGRPIEIEEDSAARAAGMLEDKMTIQQNRFHLGQKRVVAIDVRPASLHHANLALREVVDGARQKIFRRNEVSIENGDEFAFGRLHALS